MESDISNLISALEELAEDVQTASKKTPTQLEDKLDAAILKTSSLIQTALSEEDRKQWLSDLSTIAAPKQDMVNLEPSAATREATPAMRQDTISCDCPQDDLCFRNPSAPLPTSKHVRCMHGCHVIFCSATCRKRHARAHRAVCSSLQRKKVLASIGLTGDTELF